MPGGDDERHPAGFPVWVGFAEPPVAAVHIAVVAEKHDVGIICKVQFIQRLHQAAHIPVQVAHHGVIPGQLPLGLLLDPGHIWHIGPQFNIAHNPSANCSGAK